MAKNEWRQNANKTLNNCWGCLEKNQKVLWQKSKKHFRRRKKKYKAYFKGETGIFIIEKLTCDTIERCWLPEAIELRKKLGYNHDDILVWEDTSIAEKIIKMFPHENIVLNKKFNNRKPDIWFKNHNFIIEVDEGNHESYEPYDEKEREDMFKKCNFKSFWCNPNDPEFDLFTFLGEINLYITNYAKKSSKWNN